MELIIFWTVVLVGVLFLASRNSKNDKEFIGEDTLEVDVLPPNPAESESNYRKKDRVLNYSERQMYLILQSTLGNNFLILSKVRIEDFIDVNTDQLKWGDIQGLRGKIKSRHVDYLICDLATTKPLLAVELDGNSHKNITRIERDNFINDLYKSISLPVVHVNVGSNFAQESIKIKNMILSN